MTLLLVLLLATNAEADASAALALAKAQRDRPVVVAGVQTAAPGPVVRTTKAATHSHRCPYDGTVWAHADDSFGRVADHQCPQCGRVQWQVYQRFR